MELGEPFTGHLRFKKKEIECNGDCDTCNECKEIKQLIKQGKLKPKKKEDKLKLLNQLEKLMRERGI